jgi:aryl-alcohol dehydrogenase-like predicted oxidoreductase
MRKRRIGRSELQVAPLMFGGNVFGWTADEATSFSIFDALVDTGLDFIDTADVYSAWVPGNQGGESETILGKWFRQSGKRERIVLATKVSKHPQRKGLSAANIQAAVEDSLRDSLRRLQTDYIDVYFSHDDDTATPLTETLGAYQKLIEAGKVRVSAHLTTAARATTAVRASRKHLRCRGSTVCPNTSCRSPNTICTTVRNTRATASRWRARQRAGGARESSRCGRLLQSREWFSVGQVP